MSLDSEAIALLNACRAGGVRLATAESCTGGMIAAALTAIAGSSDVVECGFVVYSNAAKSDLLGVPAELITRVGAVIQCEHIAANSSHVRLDDIEHGSGGNGRVGRAAALLQDLQRRGGSQRLTGCGHAVDAIDDRAPGRWPGGFRIGL